MNRGLLGMIRRAKSTAEAPLKKANKAAPPPEAASSPVPIGPTVAAMTAGIVTVTATTYAVEQYTASSCRSFDVKDTRFDQSTFSGRFSERLIACDPWLLTHSSEEVARAKAMVSNASTLIANHPEDGSNIHHTLWEAKRIVDATLHPDTGEAVPAPFRMCGYVPFNGPICVAMVVSSSTPALLFWNWVNQSQNAAVNYFNRNASSALSNETLAKSYTAAVGSSLAVAFGLATFIKKRYDPTTASRLLRFVAFPSSVMASSLNCYIVRSTEIDTGIPLMDKEKGGKFVLDSETSVAAAKVGVYSTVATRAMLQAPVYFIPPALMVSLPVIKRYIAMNPTMAVPIATYMIIVAFGLGLPGTTAIFPQISEINVDDVEEKYQSLVDDSGARINKFYFNKGL